MESWKNSRFVITPVKLDAELYVVLSDFRFWADHIDELAEWCKDRNCEVTGMVVTFHDDITLTEFVLRWS